jgi:hypothetical protein
MTWHLVAVANAITAAAYFAIFFAILNGLRRTHQLGGTRSASPPG